MDTKTISLVAGTALLAVTTTASAGPMTVATTNVISPPQTQIEPVHYRYWHHHRHYYHGRPYGGYHRRYYHRYYGWNPGAAVAGTALGLATLPFAMAGGYYGYYPGYYGYYPYGYYGGPYYYY